MTQGTWGRAHGVENPKNMSTAMPFRYAPYAMLLAIDPDT